MGKSAFNILNLFKSKNAEDKKNNAVKQQQTQGSAAQPLQHGVQNGQVGDRPAPVARVTTAEREYQMQRARRE